MLETPAGPAHAPPFRGAEREFGGPLEPAAGLTGRALIAILRRRKLPLLVCALLIPALALIALKRVTPRYTAVGTLIYEPNQFQTARAAKYPAGRSDHRSGDVEPGRSIATACA